MGEKITDHRSGWFRILNTCRRYGLAAVAATAAGWYASAPLGSAALAAEPVGRSAVIIMYHRFGEDTLPSTNTRLDQLDAHIKELTSGRYTVLPLPKIVTDLKAGRALPDRTVGISIDDAYLSAYREAWPKFRAAGLPITMFVATDAVDRAGGNYMNWDQVREMARDGVTIGSQTASHLHMAQASPARNRQDLEKSMARFQAELGTTPRLFAYPYGEASLAVEDLVRETGFLAAFGQHSGVVHPSLGFYYLPRFAMNESFGDLDRLKLAANALPVVVEDMTPVDHLVGAKNPPAMGFTVATPLPKGLDRLACFSGHEGKARVERLGDSRFEVRVTEPFPLGRTRINCTAPTADGRWRWLGRQFYRAK